VTKDEIKAFYERMVDEHIDLAEELMHLGRRIVRTRGVKVTRCDFLNGLTIEVVEDPYADPREMVLRSGMSTALVKLEVDKPEGSDDPNA
jgi:hypothetical protein